MGILVPEATAAPAADYVSYALAIEELARVDAGTAVHRLGSFDDLLRRSGNSAREAQKERWLPALATGDVIAGFALTESDAGSDATAMRATAKTSGGGYSLDGRKQWCTSGSYAGVVMGMFRTGGPGARGVSAFLIEPSLPGIVDRARDRKTRHPHQQHRAISHSTTCGCPPMRCSAKRATGFGNAMTALTGGRIGIAAQAIGILAACLDESVKFAKERIAFGKPIGAFEGVSFKIAQMAMDLDAARLLIYRAAALADAGETFAIGGEQSETLCIYRSAQACRRSAADSRRLRIHDGVPGGAPLPRRKDHRDLRRNVGNPAAHHRAGSKLST